MKTLCTQIWNIGKDYIIEKELLEENGQHYVKQTIDATEKGNKKREKINIPSFKKREEIHAISSDAVASFYIVD